MGVGFNRSNASLIKLEKEKIEILKEILKKQSEIKEEISKPKKHSWLTKTKDSVGIIKFIVFAYEKFKNFFPH